MATQAQIDANRKNALKSTGPKSKPGKDKTRFNGLKHGLRAEQVVLPGEDPAEFAAELEGWSDDWKPQSHTRAVLVERAAAASWRLRRSSASRPTVLRELAEAAAARFDADRREAIERASTSSRRPRRRPSRCSGPTRTGVDRLIAWWDVLDAALEEGPAAWDRFARPADGPARPPCRRRPGRGRAGAPGLGPAAPGQRPRGIQPGRQPLAGEEAEDAIAELLGLADDARPELRRARKSSRTRPSSASGRSARRASTRRRRGCCCTATRCPTTARCGRRSRS